MTLLRTQLGNTLRGHRLRQRRTLRDVSGAARVSLGYLSEVERGQKEASSELLASICDALDVELADLLAEVSLELRVADPARHPVRRVAGERVVREAAVEDAPVEEAPVGPATPATPAPAAAEPALALIGGGQPVRGAARRRGTVRLAA
jgi:transcriptional regulator with XRE-family HTH domain